MRETSRLLGNSTGGGRKGSAIPGSAGILPAVGTARSAGILPAGIEHGFSNLRKKREEGLHFLDIIRERGGMFSKGVFQSRAGERATRR